MTLGPAAPGGAPAEDLFERLRERIAVERRLAATGGSIGPVDARAFGHVDATLEQAARFARVGEGLPSFEYLGPLRRTIATGLGRVLLYFFRLITLDQQRFNALAVRALRGMNATARNLHSELHALPDDLIGVLRERDERLADLEEELAARDRRLTALENASGERDQRLAARDRRLTALENASGERDQRLAALERELTECNHRIRDALAGAATDHQHEEALLAAQQTAIGDLRASLKVLRTQLDVVQRQHTAGLTPAVPTETPAAPSRPHALLNALVASEVLRGSESGIAERQAAYVPYFAGCADVLDVGCGRGEFLGLLRAAGIAARGVDADPDMVLRCREQGLDVVCADALEYLAALPEASLGGLLCTQVIEHWRTPALAEFVQQAARTLRPGAPIVVETLNPESLLVLYRWYWLDLTHERLVHPQALQYLFRATGFHALQCVFAPAPDGPARIPALAIAGTEPAALQPFNAATQYLNDLLYGSFDYAVIAHR